MMGMTLSNKTLGSSRTATEDLVLDLQEWPSPYPMVNHHHPRELYHIAIWLSVKSLQKPDATHIIAAQDVSKR
jgi:hypothetical protein